ncbi:MAG: 50S ribosomal protein L21 [Spirochaetes bacterium]|nr:50S ribosomal protein L21 [Spirochaetota bacterium]
MYAIVEIGGKQYKVEKGMSIDIEKVKAEANSTLTIDKVLMVVDGENVSVGKPYVSGASIKASVVGEVKGKKVLGVKFKKRKNYTRTVGHRPLFLTLKIDELSA